MSIFSFWKMSEMTQAERMLKILGDGAWHTNTELARRVSLRYGSVVHKLRKQGYAIMVKRISDGLYLYKMQR